MIEITPQYLASQGLSETFPQRFWAKVDKSGPIPQHMPHLGNCWVWTAALGHWGYGKIQRGDPFKGLIRAHIAAWILTVGPRTPHLYTCHHCDNPGCVRADHLYEGTLSENMQDCVRKGRYVRGECRGEFNGRHKLVRQQVIDIRKEYEHGPKSLKRLAIKYGVAPFCIYEIVHNHTWKHV